MSLFPDAPVEVEPALAPIIELRPDGVVIRTSYCADNHQVHWLAIRCGGRTTSEMRLTEAQLVEFHAKAGRILGLVKP